MKSGLTLDAMRAEVMLQSTMKEDYIVDTRRLSLETGESGVVLRMLDDGFSDVAEPLDVNATAHRQIATHTGVPAKYYDRMFKENPALLTHNVNAWFKQEPSPRMLRTLGGTARAFLSNRYRRIDHLEIMQAVLPILGEIPGVRFESCQVTDDKMYIKAVNPRLEAEVAPGDVVQAGVVISNSETGQGAVSVQPLIYRLICTNGMVVNDAATRRNHIGRANQPDENYLLYSDETLMADDRAFLMKIQDTVRATVDEAVFGKVVDIMRAAKNAKVTTADIPGVVKLASRDFGLTDAEGDGVLNHFINDMDYTLYGLANAVTRQSQDLQDYDRASALEGIGYSVLTMEPRNWQRLNQTSYLI